MYLIWVGVEFLVCLFQIFKKSLKVFLRTVLLAASCGHNFIWDVYTCWRVETNKEEQFTELLWL